jgi:HTH-type transcriptional regulator / antitoxin HigA
MKIKTIRTEKSYSKAVSRIGKIWEALPGTSEEIELRTLLVLLEDYEQLHFRRYPPDPIWAISIRMEELGLSGKDLVPCIGSEDRVSDILDRRALLTRPMIQKLSAKLKISHSALRVPYPLSK